MVSFIAEVKIFRIWPKTMDYNYYIVHGFYFGSPKNVVRKLYHLEDNEKSNLMTLVSVA